VAVSIDQQFVEYIVKSVVGNPDAVKVERRIDEKGVLLELTVDPEDLGRVIGKRGATAQSLRTLLRALGTKNDARYNLKIVDNGEPRPRRDDPRDEAADYQSDNTPDEPVADISNDDATTGDDIANTDTGDPATTGDDITSADDVSDDDLELPTSTEKEDHSSVISRTRKELEELDDLDV
jgi:predicted RNA-binding protein YlqC (UPF0109 family)